jgi:addiction module RelE/StbE family toxin
MVEIRSIVHTDSFKHDVRRIRDKAPKERLEKQIEKVAENPNLGKRLRYSLKGEYSVRVKPYRLIYTVEGDTLILLRFEHRKEAYDTS